MLLLLLLFFVFTSINTIITGFGRVFHPSTTTCFFFLSLSRFPTITKMCRHGRNKKPSKTQIDSDLDYWKAIQNRLKWLTMWWTDLHTFLASYQIVSFRLIWFGHWFRYFTVEKIYIDRKENRKIRWRKKKKREQNGRRQQWKNFSIQKKKKWLSLYYKTFEPINKHKRND